jgi:Zn-dependent oligopeptidase
MGLRSKVKKIRDKASSYGKRFSKNVKRAGRNILKPAAAQLPILGIPFQRDLAKRAERDAESEMARSQAAIASMRKRQAGGGQIEYNTEF